MTSRHSVVRSEERFDRFVLRDYSCVNAAVFTYLESGTPFGVSLIQLSYRREGPKRSVAAAAPRHWRRRRPVEFGCVIVGFVANCCPAFSTDVVVLTAARQNEQELSPRWSRAATARAKETGRLELAEGIGPGHGSGIVLTWWNNGYRGV